MEKRQAILQDEAVHFGFIGFNGTNTPNIPEVANEALATEPLIFFNFHSKPTLSCDLAFNEYSAPLDKLPLNSSSGLRKFIKWIDLEFTTVDAMPEHARLIASTCPAKLIEPKGVCLKNIKKARKLVMDYIGGFLITGIAYGESREVPVLPTSNILITLVSGLDIAHYNNIAKFLEGVC